MSEARQIELQPVAERRRRPRPGAHRRRRPRGDDPAHRGVPFARHPVRRRLLPAARPDGRRRDPDAGRRRRLPVHQRVREGADRDQDRLDRRGDPGPGRRPRDHPRRRRACASTARASAPDRGRLRRGGGARSTRPASATPSGPGSCPASPGASAGARRPGRQHAGHARPRDAGHPGVRRCAAATSSSASPRPTATTPPRGRSPPDADPAAARYEPARPRRSVRAAPHRVRGAALGRGALPTKSWRLHPAPGRDVGAAATSSASTAMTWPPTGTSPIPLASIDDRDRAALAERVDHQGRRRARYAPVRRRTRSARRGGSARAAARDVAAHGALQLRRGRGDHAGQHRRGNGRRPPRSSRGGSDTRTLPCVQHAHRLEHVAGRQRARPCTSEPDETAKPGRSSSVSSASPST